MTIGTAVRRYAGPTALLTGMVLIAAAWQFRSVALGAVGALPTFVVGGFYALRAGCAEWDQIKENRRQRAAEAIRRQIPHVDMAPPRLPAGSRFTRTSVIEPRPPDLGRDRGTDASPPRTDRAAGTDIDAMPARPRPAGEFPWRRNTGRDPNSPALHPPATSGGDPAPTWIPPHGERVERQRQAS